MSAGGTPAPRVAAVAGVTLSITCSTLSATGLRLGAYLLPSGPFAALACSWAGQHGHRPATRPK